MRQMYSFLIFYFFANQGLPLTRFQRHGYEFLVAEREHFLGVLYNNHLDKSKFRTGRTVTNIEEDSDGVKVFLDDGSVESGDIVVGADGVHSTVRNIMWEHANQRSPGTISNREQSCKSRNLVLYSLTNSS